VSSYFQNDGVNKKIQFIFYSFAHKVARGWICTICGIGVGFADIITCAKINGDQLRDVDSVWVRSDLMPLTKLVAVNTLLPLSRCVCVCVQFCRRTAKR